MGGGLFRGEVSLEDIKPEDIAIPGGSVAATPVGGEQDVSCGVDGLNVATDATCEAPSIQDFKGEFSFDFRVPPSLNSKDAQYSARLNKLFINQNRTVQIWFNVRGPADQTEALAIPSRLEGLRIRALVVYTRPDDFPHPVAVCYAHSRNR